MAIDTKKLLLNMAEENVKLIVDQILIPYAEQFVKESDNKWDDAILPFLPALQAFILKQADLIDGEEG